MRQHRRGKEDSSVRSIVPQEEAKSHGRNLESSRKEKKKSQGGRPFLGGRGC